MVRDPEEPDYSDSNLISTLGRNWVLKARSICVNSPC